MEDSAGITILSIGGELLIPFDELSIYPLVHKRQNIDRQVHFRYPDYVFPDQMDFMTSLRHYFFIRLPY